MILQAGPVVKHFGIQKKLLPIEPSVLLREANRRRASLSAGNISEMFDGQLYFNEGWVNGWSSNCDCLACLCLCLYNLR